MDLIALAEQKRQWHLGEAEKLLLFIETGRALQGEPVEEESAHTPPPPPKPPKAPRAQTRPTTGIGADTLNAAEMIVAQEGPMSTRDMLPHVLAMGIDVSGKDPVATLSARISGKGDLVTYNGKWHFKKDLAMQGLGGIVQKEAADNPAKDPSAASLFSNQEGGGTMPPP